MRLYRARLAHRQAKETLRNYRREHGVCPEFHSGEDRQPLACYRLGPAHFDEWCAICQGSQPVWESYRKAALEAGVALRALMLTCSKEPAAGRIRRTPGIARSIVVMG